MPVVDILRQLLFRQGSMKLPEGGEKLIIGSSFLGTRLEYFRLTGRVLHPLLSIWMTNLEVFGVFLVTCLACISQVYSMTWEASMTWKKEIKCIQIGKKNKLSQFANDMVLYLEHPKTSTKNLLELINKFNKVAGYKINTHNSNAFLYISNELTEREIVLHC